MISLNVIEIIIHVNIIIRKGRVQNIKKLRKYPNNFSNHKLIVYQLSSINNVHGYKMHVYNLSI